MRYLILLMLALAFEASAMECDDSCQETLVHRYFEWLGNVYRKNSSEADIDKLFTLFHQDVRYQHVEYGADFKLAEWREAFLANLQRGAYDKEKNSSIKVMKMIHGKRHVAVEYRYGHQANGDWIAEDDKGLMALIGFKGDKIVLVREYW